MHDAFRMQVADSHADLKRIKFDHLLWQPLLCFEHLVKLTTAHKRHHEVQSGRRLEKVVHANKEWMVTAEQDVFLKLGVLYLFEL